MIVVWLESGSIINCVVFLWFFEDIEYEKVIVFLVFVSFLGI